jgi:NTE family protein
VINQKTRSSILKIGLALGGGIGYGFAHVGVLKVLEESGLTVDIVSGTSVGSLVGALYASGKSAAQIEKIAEDVQWQNLLKLVIPKEGLVSLETLEDFLKKNCGCGNIEDMKIKFSAVATDLIHSRSVVFDAGSVSKAVRASCSIPGIFTPLHYNGSILVDGGITNNLPVNVVKEQGADFIIAVDVLSRSKTDLTEKPDIFNIVWQSFEILINENTKNTVYTDADVIIMPEIGNENPFDLTQRNRIIKKGVFAAESKLDEISEKLKAKDRLGERIKRFLGKKLK